jgi:hypothetical protein
MRLKQSSEDPDTQAAGSMAALSARPPERHHDDPGDIPSLPLFLLLRNPFSR